MNAAAAALLAASGALVQAQVAQTPNNPPVAPHSILVFPQRSFVSATGYRSTDRVTVRVIHPASGTAITSEPVTPQDDPATPEFDGIVEVNHPGGVCWVESTPDIRFGDLVQTITVDENGTTVVDETTVRDVTTKRPVATGPGSVAIHGTARDFVTGLPLDLGSLEQRMVIPGDLFDLNGRRTLRATAAAGADGTLTYDPVDPTANPAGLNWTATYSGLSAADIDRLTSADIETRIMWLGDVAAGVEATVYEVGAAIIKAPSAPCAAPLERLPPPPGSELIPPTPPSDLQAHVSGTNTVNLSWTASTDNVGVTAYEVYRNGALLATLDATVQGFTTAYTDLNVPAGTYTYTLDALDLVGNQSERSDSVAATTTLHPDVGVSGATINEPPLAPLSMISFPERDFVSFEGYLPTDRVTVQVIRNGFLISTSTKLVPNAEGIVEVNHPGGGCWEGNTPEIRPGDKIRSIVYGEDGTIRRVDQTTTSNVTAERPTLVAPGTVQIHGTAMGFDGNPLPLDQLNERLINGRDRFEINGGRRALNAPGDGELQYDTVNNPTGIKWTATYTGLSDADVQRALAAESRILWLGADPLALTELTIFENSPDIVNGPSAPCTTPSEPFDQSAPSTPQKVTAALNGGVNVEVKWEASVDDTQVFGYSISRDGVVIRYVGGSTLSFIDLNPGPGRHAYTVDAFDSAKNHSLNSAPASIDLNDVTPPSVPLNLVATLGVPPTVRLTWSVAADNVGVTGYVLERTSGSGSFQLPLTCGTNLTCNGATLSFDDAAEGPGTYRYTVSAVDAEGNHSAASAPATVVVTGALDNEAPTQPQALVADTRDVYTGATAPSLGSRDVRLTWATSSDNVGVTSYAIYRARITAIEPREVGGFTKIADVATGTTYTDLNVPAGTYDYTVEARDSAGNASERAGVATAVSVEDAPVLPHSVIPFPARDFVSASGFGANEGPVMISVIRGGKTIAVSTLIPPADDPTTSTFDGIVEVNHPGGGCWASANTPDLRAGDIVRLTTFQGVADQTTTANVTAQRPIQISANTVVIHGTAQDALGKPLPVGSLEQRLVSGADRFDNGKRTLRAGAGADGVIEYDGPDSIYWTATYSGLSAADVTRALAAESRVLWLGRNVVAGNELTTFENGDGVVGGPSGAPCTAPLEPTAPVVSFSPATIDFGAQAAVPPTTSAQRNVTLSNAGTTPVSNVFAYLAGANTGEFSIVANNCPATLAPGSSCTVGVAFAPTTIGTRSASLNFTNNAANTSFQTVVLSGSGVDAAAPGAPAWPAAAQKFPVAGFSVSNGTAPVVIAWTAPTTGTVSGYEIQQSTNGGAFVAAATPEATTTTVTLPLTLGGPTGTTYQFQVRAFSTATGSRRYSSWVKGPKFTLQTVDETDLSNTSFNGNWTTASLAGAVGGQVRFASTSKDKVSIVRRLQYTVTGSIAWISSGGPDRGIATVSVDGGAVTSVDLFNATQQVGIAGFVANNLAGGNAQHTVTVQLTGTKRATSTGTRVYHDAFVVIR
jgi:ASPM-SPD-2-Hydin domain-containing protein/fibronectin type III domain protein